MDVIDRSFRNKLIILHVSLLLVACEDKKNLAETNAKLQSFKMTLLNKSAIIF